MREQRGNSRLVAVDLVNAVDQLELSSDGTGGVLDRVSVGEEARRVRLDLGERKVRGGVGCKLERTTPKFSDGSMKGMGQKRWPYLRWRGVRS